MAEESCNQNNDILVRAEIRRSGEEREEGAGVPRVRDNYTGLSSPSLPVTNMEISNINRPDSNTTTLGI